MNEYVKYIRRVWEELGYLPKEERDRKMSEFMHPSMGAYIQAPIVLSDKEEVYCDPSPRGWKTMCHILEKEMKK